MDKKKRLDYSYKNEAKNHANVKKTQFEKKQRISYDYSAHSQENVQRHNKQSQNIVNDKNLNNNPNSTVNKSKNNQRRMTGKEIDRYLEYKTSPQYLKTRDEMQRNANYTKRNNNVRQNENSSNVENVKNSSKKGKNILFKPRSKNNDLSPNKEPNTNVIDLAKARDKRKKRLILYRIAAIFLICVGFVFSFNVFFTIDEIVINGQTQYSSEQIAAIFSPKVGDNLFLFSTDEEISKLQLALPYLDDIEIKRNLSGSIHLNVSQAVEQYSMSSVSGWVVLNDELRVLSIAPIMPEGITYINGIEAQEPVLGTQVVVKDVDVFAILNEFLSVVSELEFTPVTHIDLSDDLQINFTYESRIKIVLGTSNDMFEKMEWAKYLITPSNDDALGENSEGVLDVSTRDSAGRLQAIWNAESI